MVGRSSLNIASGVSITEYSSSLRPIGDYYLAIYGSSGIHVCVVHKCTYPAQFQLNIILNIILFTEDAPVYWHLSFIINLWNCVLRRREIHLHVMYSMNLETDWVRYQRNQRCRISSEGWSTVCSLLLNKWHQYANNIYDIDIQLEFSFSYCLKTDLLGF